MNMFQSVLAGGVKDFSAEALNRSYFVARNPTTGTGIASLDGATARSATANLMSVYNTDTTNEKSLIIPVRLWLRATAVNTSASALFLNIYTDEIDRYTSGGSELTNVPTGYSAVSGYVEATSKARVNFGVLVTAGASDENRIYDREVHTTILAADDTFDFWFGAGPTVHSVAGNTGSHETAVHSLPPVWIGPGASMLVDTYGPSQAADPAWEVEFWWIEHPNNN